MRWTEIRERFHDDVAILYPRGTMTLRENDHLVFDRIRRLVASNHVKIVLNLADLSCLDSDGLAEVVDGYKAVTPAGGVMTLCAAGPRIRALLRLTKLTGIFQVFESETEALQHVSGASQANV
jgi:anti-sigma B factor antagonist